MASWIEWVAIKVVFAACLWAGFVAGVEGARSVAVFWVWLSFVASFSALSDRISAVARAKGPLVPTPLMTVYAALVVVFLVWHGSWVLAAAYLIQSALVIGVHQHRGNP